MSWEVRACIAVTVIAAAFDVLVMGHWYGYLFGTLTGVGTAAIWLSDRRARGQRDQINDHLDHLRSLSRNN